MNRGFRRGAAVLFCLALVGCGDPNNREPLSGSGSASQGGANSASQTSITVPAPTTSSAVTTANTPQVTPTLPEAIEKGEFLTIALTDESGSIVSIVTARLTTRSGLDSTFLEVDKSGLADVKGEDLVLITIDGVVRSKSSPNGGTVGIRLDGPSDEIRIQVKIEVSDGSEETIIQRSKEVEVMGR